MSELAPLDFWLAAPTPQLRAGAFAASQYAASEIMSHGIEADGAREVVIRLLALLDSRGDDLADFRPMIDALTREVGLFPYIDDAVASYADMIAREAFRSPSDRGLVFHIEQQRIFKALLDRKNVVASAPTSFGKSLLIDSLLGQPYVKRAAVIVPTLALLDETRRRLLAKLPSDTSVIFHRSQEAPLEGKVLFLGTQERLLDRGDLTNLDLLVVDEFYKADPSRADGRFVALNAAISKLAKVSKQFFLIGPFIDGIDAREWRYAQVEFIKTNYRTVAFDPIDVASSRDDVKNLSKLLKDNRNHPALVFVRSPKSARELAEKLIEEGLDLRTDWASELSRWAAANYTDNWGIVDALAHGIGYHHGRLPRAFASTIVRGFNRGHFDVLLCTSTLIEGVNTAAKSVFVWDKEIDGRSVDFFTFANIRGRAGRMGHHYVGKVFYFHPQPTDDRTDIQVPGLGSGNDIDEILVHYDAVDVDLPAQQRLSDWVARTGLSYDDLKRYGGFGFGRLADLRKSIDQLSISSIQEMSWRGLPKYKELEATCMFLWSSFGLNRSGPHGAKQMTWMLWNLFKSKSITKFFDLVFRGERPMQADDVFSFLRSCEFSYPEAFMCLQASIIGNRSRSPDYSFFVAGLENWFLPESVKSLEDIGFPIVLFERSGIVPSAQDSADDLVIRVRGARQSIGELSSIDNEMVSDTLVERRRRRI
ncbi:DEAD/DEAH box helicase [Xanthobacter versatilis]|uniref:DEAD/DEAH box helicase n=1 Tax=Xanthobacter autotrophicus (strain ATCC BAA-1158 / Py2) TaxID=78245 RepID=UPI00372A0D97